MWCLMVFWCRLDVPLMWNHECSALASALSPALISASTSALLSASTAALISASTSAFLSARWYQRRHRRWYQRRHRRCYQRRRRRWYQRRHRRWYQRCYQRRHLRSYRRWFMDIKTHQKLWWWFDAGPGKPGALLMCLMYSSKVDIKVVIKRSSEYIKHIKSES